MKKITCILLFCIAIIIPTYANTFSVEGKAINLIDFDGYKHQDYSVLAEQYKSLNGVVLYDLLIPDNANCPAIDLESMVYNDFFIVCVQPTMLYGADINEELFSYLRETISDSYSSEGFGISAEKLNADYAEQIIIPLEAISEPRLFINESNCIGFSTAVSYEGIDFSILNYNALTLVKGKIIWLSYYAAYNSVIDYENNTSKFIRFIKQFIKSNQDEKILTEQEKNAQNYAFLIANDLKSEMKTISSDGYSKAYGLKYSFLVPKSFEEKTSEKTHIVHSLSKNYEDYYVNVNVMVDDSSSSIIELLGDEYSIEEYKDEIIKQYLPKTATVINSGKTTIGGQSNALFIEYTYNQSVLNGLTMNIYCYQIISQYDGVITAITFIMGGLADNNFDSLIDVFRTLFMYISSTFSFIGNDNSIQSNVSKQIEKEINNAVTNFLVLSILAPVIIGLILGLIVRYLVVRHPVNKHKATVFSIVIGLILILIAYTEFEDVGAIGVLVGTILCHFIIRIGHAEYDEEVEKIKKQKAEAEQMFDEAFAMNQKAESKYSKAKEEQEKAQKTWQEAQEAKNDANEEKEKAKYASTELEKLKEELRRVKERNKRLEEEAQSRSIQTSYKNVIKDRVYYEAILGIEGSYSKADLRKAYLQKSMLYHPDKVNSLGPKLKALAEEEMKEINVAYNKLQLYCVN